MQPEHKYRVRAAVEGGFSFCSDLARTNGVGGTAPTPMDYAAAAVAMCTATTVRLKAVAANTHRCHCGTNHPLATWEITRRPPLVATFGWTPFHRTKGEDFGDSREMPSKANDAG
ncbi:unnamed protein product [Closterium sp. Yama58-4]|nr:unnamed protein product [Closterium sp. Yama58-4]